MWTKFGRDTLRGDWRQLHNFDASGSLDHNSPRNSAIISGHSLLRVAAVRHRPGEWLFLCCQVCCREVGVR